jgi:hypothetical protein
MERMGLSCLARDMAGVVNDTVHSMYHESHLANRHRHGRKLYDNHPKRSSPASHRYHIPSCSRGHILRLYSENLTPVRKRAGQEMA